MRYSRAQNCPRADRAFARRCDSPRPDGDSSRSRSVDPPRRGVRPAGPNQTSTRSRLPNRRCDRHRLGWRGGDDHHPV